MQQELHRHSSKDCVPYSVEVQWGVKVPLRDGTQLNATRYLPKGLKTAAPYIVTLTPYVSDRYHKRGTYFAAQGFPFVVVDCRGRGNSEGQFRPYIQEAQDGYDLIEWAARQPNCTGKVAMWGGSYAGYNQWATAKEFPPHLAAIVPTAAPYMGLDFPMRNNIFCPYVMQWIVFTAGRASQEKIFADDDFWAGIYRDWLESGRPFRDLDTLVGHPSKLFHEWLSHPEPGAYWDAHNPTPEQYATLDLPILTITGSYDDDQPGALEHYRQHMRYASRAQRDRHYLVIGPWDHPRTASPEAEFGGVEFGPASLLDIPRLHQEWYAWTMLDGPRPEFLKKRVAYYVMGAERWRYADDLDDVTARHETWFLDSRSNANDVFSSGSLSAQPGIGSPDCYRYDPSQTSGPEVNAEAQTAADSLVDQQVTLALRGRQLIYHSAPLEKDLEVSGFFRFTAWLSIDCPDTDFYVTVHEILLDGSSVRLSTDVLRARYRKDLRQPHLIDTREPRCYEFDRFTFVARLIGKGHRVRLIVAPTGRTNQTLFTQKNYNGGGTVAEESVSDARAVTVKLHHDGQRPSALHIPIGRSIEPDEAGTTT